MAEYRQELGVTGGSAGASPQTEPQRLGRRIAPRILLGAGAAVLVAVPLSGLILLVRGQNSALHTLDQTVAEDLHRFVQPRPGLRSVLGAISVITSPNTVRILSAAGVIALWARGRRRTAVWLAVTISVGGGLDPILKDLIGRARPVLPDPIATAPGYAFPSGHALNTLLFSLCLIVVTHRSTRGRPVARAAIWTLAALITLITGFDRIALGVHFVSDVLGGWVIAAATVCAVSAAFQADTPDDTAEPPPVALA